MILKKNDRKNMRPNGTAFGSFNMMQFLPGFVAVSTEGMSGMVYDAIPQKEDLEITVEQRPSDQAWEETLAQVFDDAAKECACTLMEQGVSAPSAVGYELVDSSGAVVAECEMAWERQKIALLLSEQMDGKDKFIENGWTVFTLEDSIPPEMFQGGVEDE